MKNELDTEILEEYQDFPVRIGQMVPDMELDAYYKGEETKISLSDYRGKWLILFFYPADFSFICPTELEDMADLYEEFQKEGAEVLSVSTDTVYTHKSWHDVSEAIKKIKFPMLSDRNQSLCYMMGAMDEESGNALRGTFVINPDGKLQMLELGDNNSVGRNAKELLRKLQGAKFARENKGRVCPAKWEPGDDTLKPGMDLVGKI
jgi:peroxiredoxin